MTSQFWFRGVRPSKFRHVYGSSRKENYTDISIHRTGSDVNNICAVNPVFIAVESSSAFVVIPLNNTGRIDFQKCKVTGHASQIFDLKWNPFNDHQIASASDDCTIKLWDIPEGGLTHSLSEWSNEFLGHRRKVTQLEWHPSAENVLISASFDNLIIVWDVSDSPLNGNCILKIIDCHVDQIFSLAINREGSYIATTSKDKILRVIEPRTGIVVSQGLVHNGSKQSKVVFLNNNRVFTTGFSKNSDRQYSIWEMHDLKTPLATADIDSSSGILQPFFDYETKTIYLCGKGEGCIRYYEIVDEQPYIYYLNQFISGQPQKALGCMPKRGLNVSACEIFRFYKVQGSGNIIEPISFIVPRKSSLFQEDLYPDTLSNKASMKVNDWFVLGSNAKPNMMSMKSGETIQESVMRKSLMKRDEPEKKQRQEIIKVTDNKVCEKNINKKFAFLAQETIPDYRTSTEKFSDKNEKTNTNQSTKFHHLQSIYNQENSKDTKEKLLIHEEKSFTKLTSSQAENELKKVVLQQQDEIKNLRNHLKTSDKRIRELEFEVKKLRLQNN